MRIPVTLARTLVLVLAFRMVGAPLSPRPSKAVPVPHSFYVMRVRCWPPQRLQRFSSNSKLLRLLQGKDKPMPEGAGRLLSLLALWSSPQHPLSLDLETSRGLAPGRFTDCLRC
jgi:hypothetical protein